MKLMPWAVPNDIVQTTKARAEAVGRHGLLDRLSAAKSSATQVVLSGWHRVAVMDRSKLEGGSDLSAARFVGWRCLIGDGNVVWATADMDNDGGLNGILRGAVVEGFVAAIQHAQSDTADPGRREPVFLRVQATRASALWLRPSDPGQWDCVIPLPFATRAPGEKAILSADRFLEDQRYECRAMKESDSALAHRRQGRQSVP